MNFKVFFLLIIIFQLSFSSIFALEKKEFFNDARIYSLPIEIKAKSSVNSHLSDFKEEKSLKIEEISKENPTENKNLQVFKKDNFWLIAIFILTILIIIFFFLVIFFQLAKLF